MKHFVEFEKMFIRDVCEIILESHNVDVTQPQRMKSKEGVFGDVHLTYPASDTVKKPVQWWKV